MTMYASNAGKSGGEFFTPQEVSELLARITVVGKTEVNKVYDPACGSGSLLLKFAKVLGRTTSGTGFFGQESQPDDLQPVPDQRVPARAPRMPRGAGCGVSSLRQCCVVDEGFVALRRRPAGGGVKPPQYCIG